MEGTHLITFFEFEGAALPGPYQEAVADYGVRVSIIGAGLSRPTDFEPLSFREVPYDECIAELLRIVFGKRLEIIIPVYVDPDFQVFEKIYISIFRDIPPHNQHKTMHMQRLEGAYKTGIYTF